MECLNSLHRALKFSMESEEDGKLPFMDVLVRREETGFTTAVCRKPTFTGLYTRWDSYCSTSRKIAFIRSLTHSAKTICSPIYPSDEIGKLKSILEKNGFLTAIVETIIQQTRQVESNLRYCLKSRRNSVFVSGGLELLLRFSNQEQMETLKFNACLHCCRRPFFSRTLSNSL